MKKIPTVVSNLFLLLFSSVLITQANPANYNDANAALQPPKANQKRIIFFGDSITRDWPYKDQLEKLPVQIVNRGIGGELTGSMVRRFHTDVLNLNPAGVFLLGGTNDIMRYGVSGRDVADNIARMSAMAKEKGIKVFIGTVLPSREEKDSPTDEKPAEKNKRRDEANRLLKEYCEKNKVTLLDYYTVLVDKETGRMALKYTADEYHPNLKGYKLMTDLVEKALRKELLD